MVTIGEGEEETLERVTELYEHYLPKVGALYGADLSDVPLKDMRYLAADCERLVWEQFAKEKKEAGETLVPDEDLRGLVRLQRKVMRWFTGFASRRIASKTMRNAVMAYDPAGKSVYAHLQRLNWLSDGQIATSVVHELGHAVHDALADTEGLDYEVRKALEEGFAEYLSHEGFAGSYDTPGAVEASEQGASVLRTVAALKSLAQMLGGDLSEKDVPSSVMPYALGYVLFSEAALNCLPPEWVLRHPPKEYAEVVSPRLYLRRIAEEFSSELPEGSPLAEGMMWETSSLVEVLVGIPDGGA